MFDDLSDMIHFITLAPWFIFSGFAGSFLLTFSTIKLAQSDAIYDWFAIKISERRASQAAEIRRVIMRDAIEFRAGRKVSAMSKVEQRIYLRMLESGYKKIERLYKDGGGGNGQSE
jgi:hypothetical protein